MEPRSRQEWSSWVRKAEASGLSIAVFAAQHGVSRSGLYYWRRKLREPTPRTGKPSRPLAFVRLVPAAPSSSPSSCAPLEVALANGRVIRVPPAFDETSLARLLNIVEGLPR